MRSKSGPLGASKRSGGWLELDFPNLSVEEIATPAIIREALKDAPDTVFYVAADPNYMVVLKDEAAVKAAGSPGNTS